MNTILKDYEANVKLTSTFWRERQRLFCDEVLERQWRILNGEEEVAGVGKSHCIDNFRVLAGEKEGEAVAGFPFMDHDLGKWMEGAAYSLLLRPNPSIEERMDYLADLLRRAQRADGYLNTYYMLFEPGREWTNFKWGHELLNAGNLLEAAIVYRRATGKTVLLEVVTRFIDLIYDLVFSADHYIYDGHEEIEIALIKLYLLNGEKKYLDLAKRLVDTRGVGRCLFLDEDSADVPGFGLEYFQAHRPVREQVSAEGHAVRAAYLYTAMAELGRLCDDDTLRTAAWTLWDDIVQKKLYIIGGIGSEQHGERFTEPYDLPNAYSYSETCAAIGLMMFSRALLRDTPNARVADVMEKALYNNVLAGISYDGRSYFYVNPLEVQPNVVHKRWDHNTTKTMREEWMSCPCCPPNLLRLVLSLQEYVYTLRPDGAYINLLVSHEATFTMDGTAQALSFQGNEPWDGTFELTAQTALTQVLHIKVPYWSEKCVVIKNGQKLSCGVQNGYLELENVQQGDTFRIEFSLRPRYVYSDPRIADDSGKTAVERGYLVYCVEQADNGVHLSALSVDDRREPAEAHEALFGGIQTVTVYGDRLVAPSDTLYSFEKPKAQETAIKLVPYALWNNRGEGEMIVWLRTQQL